MNEFSQFSSLITTNTILESNSLRMIISNNIKLRKLTTYQALCYAFKYKSDYAFSIQELRVQNI